MKAGKIQAGTLRQSLTLQQRVTSTDAEGTPLEGWTTIGPVRADVQPLGGRELAMAGQLEMKLSHQVTTYWRTDLARANSATSTSGHNMRFLWAPISGGGTRILDIQLVQDPDGHQRVLSVLCLEYQD